MIRSDSKIDEDWEEKIKRKGRDFERERERESERNKRGNVVQGVRLCCAFFFNVITNIITVIEYKRRLI